VAFCPNCGAQVADGAACPKCAAGPTNVAVATTTTGVGLTDNMAGALAYVTIIPAIVFLVVEPYNRKRFIRFHAFQSIFFCVAWMILWFALRIIVGFPVFGWLTALLWPIVDLVGFIIWLIVVLKAFQGQMFKLPVIGDLAEKQAGA
jgi:uncharacterized membrane protein